MAANRRKLSLHPSPTPSSGQLDLGGWRTLHSQVGGCWPFSDQRVPVVFSDLFVTCDMLSLTKDRKSPSIKGNVLLTISREFQGTNDWAIHHQDIGVLLTGSKVKTWSKNPTTHLYGAYVSSLCHFTQSIFHDCPYVQGATACGFSTND